MADAPRTKRNRPGLVQWLARSLAAALIGSLAFVVGIGSGVGLVGYLERAGTLAPPPRVADQRPFVVMSSPAPQRPTDSRIAGPEVERSTAPTTAARAEPEPAPTAGSRADDPQAAPGGPDAAPAPPDAPEPVVPAAEPGPAADTRAVPAWMLAAVPVPLPQDRPMVAIIIDDLAVDQVRSKRAIALPAPLTMSFLPYGANLGILVADARRRGHEIMVHLPMEPQDPEADPGPNALMTNFDDRLLRVSLRRNLAALDGYVGVNNHMGSRFSAWEQGMRTVMQALQRRGLIYLDSLTTPDTVAAALARDFDVPYLARDIFLDYDRRPETVVEQLQRLERIARTRGYAIGIGHPYDATIEELQRWLETAEQRGFVVVPVSTIARANFALRG